MLSTSSGTTSTDRIRRLKARRRKKCISEEGLRRHLESSRIQRCQRCGFMYLIWRDESTCPSSSWTRLPEHSPDHGHRQGTGLAWFGDSPVEGLSWPTLSYVWSRKKRSEMALNHPPKIGGPFHQPRSTWRGTCPTAGRTQHVPCKVRCMQDRRTRVSGDDGNHSSALGCTETFLVAALSRSHPHSQLLNFTHRNVPIGVWIEPFFSATSCPS